MAAPPKLPFVLVGLLLVAACAHQPPAPDDDPDEVTESTLEGHRDIIQAIAFSRDGSRLASVSLDGTTRIWSVDDGATQQTFEHKCTNQRDEPWVYDVAFGGADGLVALACQTETRLWSVRDERFVGSLPTGRDSDALPARYAVEFDPSGRYLAQASWDAPGGTIRVWDTREESLVREVAGYGPVAFAPNADAIAHTVARDDDSASSAGTLELGAYLAKRHQDKVVVTDLDAGGSTRTLEGTQAVDDALAFSADGAFIVGTNGQTASMWRRDTGARVATTPCSLDGAQPWASASPVCAVGVGASSTVVVGTLSGSVGRWSTEDSALSPGVQREIRWATDPALSQPVDYPELFYFLPKMLAVSPDGRWLASTTGDAVVTLYSLR